MNSENFTGADIGRMIEGKGVYIGTWEPVDRDGNSLGKTFNVFAAPEALNTGNKLFTYKEAAQEVASRKWLGHDGVYIEDDTALYQGLADGSAIGKWFIPTRDLLCGRSFDGKKVRENNLYDLREVGDLKDILTTTDNGSDYAHWNWSSTSIRGHKGEMWGTDFTDGHEDWDITGTHRVNALACRVELALN